MYACNHWLGSFVTVTNIGTNRSTVEPKQVMFSDGIRPGGDLTELDGVESARSPTQSTSRRTKKVDKSGYTDLLHLLNALMVT